MQVGPYHNKYLTCIFLEDCSKSRLPLKDRVDMPR